jgi:hypothetical protein
VASRRLRQSVAAAAAGSSLARRLQSARKGLARVGAPARRRPAPLGRGGLERNPRRSICNLFAPFAIRSFIIIIVAAVDHVKVSDEKAGPCERT